MSNNIWKKFWTPAWELLLLDWRNRDLKVFFLFPWKNIVAHTKKCRNIIIPMRNYLPGIWTYTTCLYTKQYKHSLFNIQENGKRVSSLSNSNFFYKTEGWSVQDGEWSKESEEWRLNDEWWRVKYEEWRMKVKWWRVLE